MNFESFLYLMAILLSNSLLTVLTWAYILGRAGGEVKGIFKQVKSTIKTIKGDN